MCGSTPDASLSRSAASCSASAADPRWSPEKEQKTIQKYFLPEEQADVEIVRSEHYIIFSTAPGADRVAKAMEEIYRAFAETYPFEEPEGEALLPVFLLKDHSQYTEWSMRATGWTRAEAVPWLYAGLPVLIKLLAVLALQRSVLMTAGGAAGAELEEGKSETHTTDPDPVAPAVGRRV